MNITLQYDHAWRSRAIHFLRRWEQGQAPKHPEVGVCGNLCDVLRYDQVTGVRLNLWNVLPSHMLLQYPGRKPAGIDKAGQSLAVDVYDMIDTLCVEWPEASGQLAYPIDGVDGYLKHREYRRLWGGTAGEKRRRLCGWLADMLEHEEV